jgi:hypothetical protein
MWYVEYQTKHLDRMYSFGVHICTLVYQIYRNCTKLCSSSFGTFTESSSIIILLPVVWVRNLIPHFEGKPEFESKVMGRVLGPKREQVMNDHRKLHNE